MGRVPFFSHPLLVHIQTGPDKSRPVVAATDTSKKEWANQVLRAPEYILFCFVFKVFARFNIFSFCFLVYCFTGFYRCFPHMYIDTRPCHPSIRPSGWLVWGGPMVLRMRAEPTEKADEHSFLAPLVSAGASTRPRGSPVILYS